MRGWLQVVPSSPDTITLISPPAIGVAHSCLSQRLNAPGYDAFPRAVRASGAPLAEKKSHSLLLGSSKCSTGPHTCSTGPHT